MVCCLFKIWICSEIWWDLENISKTIWQKLVVVWVVICCMQEQSVLVQLVVLLCTSVFAFACRECVPDRCWPVAWLSRFGRFGVGGGCWKVRWRVCIAPNIRDIFPVSCISKSWPFIICARKEFFWMFYHSQKVLAKLCLMYWNWNYCISYVLTVMKNVIDIMECEWNASLCLVVLSYILKPVDKFCTCVTDISICNWPFQNCVYIWRCIEFL